MRIRDWDDIVRDVVESDVDPEGWRAVAGDRSVGLGEDLYLAHPGTGIYHLKTYAKNPFTVRGVGARVARSIDDEIGPCLPTNDDARFAIQSPPSDEDEAKARARRVEETVRAHADAPTTPDALFEDLMDALESPAFGPVDYELDDRPENLDRLATTFDEAEELLNAELDDLIDDEGIGRGFM